MTPIICIYHDACADGGAAAWAVKHGLGARPNVSFYPGKYSDKPPDVSGAIVIMVDFSYKRDVVLEMAKSAVQILIIDHHKSAIEDLHPGGGVHHAKDVSDPETCWETWVMSVLEDFDDDGCAVSCVFDLNRSGAGLAWDFFHPRIPRPRVIDHVEDRDLWRFKLPHTREISAAVYSYPTTPDSFARVVNIPIHDLIADGRAITRARQRDMEQILKGGVRYITIAGVSVPAICAPRMFASDLAHMIHEQEQAAFAVVYYEDAAWRYYSLRSDDQHMDVSKIAERFGGGGHRNASGFRMPLMRAYEMEVSRGIG